MDPQALGLSSSRLLVKKKIKYSHFMNEFLLSSTENISERYKNRSKQAPISLVIRGKKTIKRAHSRREAALENVVYLVFLFSVPGPTHTPTTLVFFV